jgi:hypothetical protein
MVAMLAFCSLGVDLGRVWVVKSELQLAADAAARYAAGALGRPADARRMALAAAADNNADGSPVVLVGEQDVEMGIWLPQSRRFISLSSEAESTANAIRVTARRVASRGTGVSLLFAQAVGRRTCDVHATAIASTAGREYGIVGIDKVHIKDTLYTDSYDSAAGRYSLSTAGSLGSIASNGDIKLNHKAEVHGGLFYGSGKKGDRHRLDPPAAGAAGVPSRRPRHARVRQQQLQHPLLQALPRQARSEKRRPPAAARRRLLS